MRKCRRLGDGTRTPATRSTQAAVNRERSGMIQRGEALRGGYCQRTLAMREQDVAFAQGLQQRETFSRFFRQLKICVGELLRLVSSSTLLRWNRTTMALLVQRAPAVEAGDLADRPRAPASQIHPSPRRAAGAVPAWPARRTSSCNTPKIRTTWDDTFVVVVQDGPPAGHPSRSVARYRCYRETATPGRTKILPSPMRPVRAVFDELADRSSRRGARRPRG